MVQRARLALSFLSRIPVGKLPDVPAGEWEKAAAFFPPVGAIIALISLLPLFCISSLSSSLSDLHSLLVAALIVALQAFVTRGLHLDGLADMADGYGVWTQERRLEVMKDSTNGAFALITLICHIVVKVILGALIITNGAWLSFVAVAVASRFLVVFMSKISTYPREKGTASMMVGKISKETLITASLFLLPLLLVSFFWAVLIVMILTMYIVKQSADEKIGGITGDILGATLELSESAGLLTFVLLSL